MGLPLSGGRDDLPSIKKGLIRALLSRFMPMELHPSFLRMMIEKKGVISGSSSLWMFLKLCGSECDWFPNDLDIWTMETNGHSSFYSHLQHFFIRKNVQFDSTTQSGEEYEDIDQGKDGFVSCLITLNDYLPINTIGVFQRYVNCFNSPIFYIKSSFDQTAVLSFFDGDGLGVWYPEETKALKSYRNPAYLANPFSERGVVRVQKYQSRGFEMDEMFRPLIDTVKYIYYHM